MGAIQLATLESHLFGAGGGTLPGSAVGDLDFAEQICCKYMGMNDLWYNSSIADVIYIEQNGQRHIVFNRGPVGHKNNQPIPWNSLTVNGDTVSSTEWEFKDGLWALEFLPGSTHPGFMISDLVIANYDQGYETKGSGSDVNTPDDIKTAVCKAYENVASSVASGVSSEKIGDYAISYHSSSTQAAAKVLSSEIKSLLQPFTQPRYL